MTRRQGESNGFTGFSYVEVLVAMTLIAVALVPAVNALRVGVTAAAVHEVEVVRHFELAGRQETVLAQSFANLASAAAVAGGPTVPTSYSDAPGTQDRVLVFIAGFDADDADTDDDPFTGADAGVLWVAVEIEDTVHSLATLALDK